MKNLTPAMHQQLSNGLTHFCHCWRIVRTDGVVLGLTNHDADIEFEGVGFRADAAIHFSIFETRLGMASHGPEAAGNLGSDLITDDDLQAGVYDHAAFQLFLVDWQAPENRMSMMNGYFGPVRLEKGRFHVDLRGTGQEINRPQGRFYQLRCDAALGDRRCRVNLSGSAFRWQGEVLACNGTQLLLPRLGFAKGWFTDGLVRVNGIIEKFFVRTDTSLNDGRQLTLWQTPPAALQAGSYITLTAGCDKRLESCANKFSNAKNYQGFPDLPDGRVLINVRPG